ncbi:MAG: N-acetyltransferase [Acidobacteria bacterium]|nr:N-acetyltransferase [Acidobacteriota bacterium]
MDVVIRQENSDDFEAVHEINALAFGQENEAELVRLLRSSDAFVPGLSLVAEIEELIVGHILFSKIQIIDEENNVSESLSLAPMSVRPGYQRKGIGGELIRSGLDKAKELNYGSVIVLGHEHYYPKFGFVAAEKWNIIAPLDVPQNVFMGIELVPNALENVTGTVKYPKEFEAV